MHTLRRTSRLIRGTSSLLTPFRRYGLGFNANDEMEPGFISDISPAGTTAGVMEDDEFSGEAPYIREDGRIGSVFELTDGPETHRVVEDIPFSANHEDYTNFQEIFKNKDEWSRISQSVWRYRAVLDCVSSEDGIFDAMLLHPSSYAICDDSLMTNYHGIPKSRTKLSRNFAFSRIEGILNWPLHQLRSERPYQLLSHWDLTMQIPALNENGFVRKPSDYTFEPSYLDELGVEFGSANANANVYDPVSNQRWTFGFERGSQDLACIDVSPKDGCGKSAFDWNKVLVPACYDMKDLEINETNVAFVGYFGFLSKGEHRSAKNALCKRLLTNYGPNAPGQSRIDEEADDLLKNFQNYSKVISCGKVIGVNNNNFCVATECTSMIGASASPYFFLSSPQSGVVGTHLGHGIRGRFEDYANRILFMSVNNPNWIALWSQKFLPRAKMTIEGKNDKKSVNYDGFLETLNKAMPFIEKHETIIGEVNPQIDVNVLRNELLLRA